MAFLEWKEEYCTNIDTIDEQHKILMRMMNKLHMTLHFGREKEKVNVVLDNLITFTSDHFSSEEVNMRQIEFPGIDEHIHEHTELLKSLSDFQKMINKQVPVSFKALEKFMRSWLENHLKVSDLEYGKYARLKAQESYYLPIHSETE